MAGRATKAYRTAVASPSRGESGPLRKRQRHNDASSDRQLRATATTAFSPPARRRGGKEKAIEQDEPEVELEEDDEDDMVTESEYDDDDDYDDEENAAAGPSTSRRVPRRAAPTPAAKASSRQRQYQRQRQQRRVTVIPHSSVHRSAATTNNHTLTRRTASHPAHTTSATTAAGTARRAKSASMARRSSLPRRHSSPPPPNQRSPNHHRSRTQASATTTADPPAPVGNRRTTALRNSSNLHLAPPPQAGTAAGRRTRRTKVFSPLPTNRSSSARAPSPVIRRTRGNTGAVSFEFRGNRKRKAVDIESDESEEEMEDDEEIEVLEADADEEEEEVGVDEDSDASAEGVARRLRSADQSLVMEEMEEEDDESAEADSDGNTPQPATSHETSPDPSRRSTSTRTNKVASAKRRQTRRHVPTPPPSSGNASSSQDDTTSAEEEEEEEEDDLDEEEEEDDEAENLEIEHSELVQLRRRVKKSVSVDAPRGRLTRTTAAAGGGDQLRRLRNGKSVDNILLCSGSGSSNRAVSNLKHEDKVVAGPSPPVAHRTRRSLPPAPVSPAPSPKGKRGKKVVDLKGKGKSRAVEQDEEDAGMDISDQSFDVASDEGEEEEEAEEDEEQAVSDVDDAEMADASAASTRRGTKTTPAAKPHPAPRRTRGRTTVKSPPQQVVTPPSDGDEESGADDEDEDEEDESREAELVVRHLRNGKTVPLPAPAGDEAMDHDDEEGDDDEEQRDDGVSLDLRQATKNTLMQRKREELVRLCKEHELEPEGTKKELVHALLEWRDAAVSSGDDSSGQSTASAASNATARAETKTQALKVIESGATEVGTPLLMRRNRLSSPGKPRTPEQTKRDEQEEVNALDLESLQLQDKEIPADKLVKLEKVGSGGFKDVFKGTYRKKTIAIADIRGHLTEMDIKELGLLRDLRHPNIVHFIGVSIPQEPSTVPVMIVTELCANGDLFDYIRGTKHPPFVDMLEIMLGIAKGLEYLHTRSPPIIHRDIKSSNVLITASGVAKLNDFGLAKVKKSTQSVIRSLVGTVNWQAPELWVANPRYNEKVDVYSVALVYWEILQWHQPVKRYPFESMNEHAIYDAVGHKNLRPSTASIGRTWGAEILDLVEAGWNGDPAQRPAMRDIVLLLGVMITTEKEKAAALAKPDSGKRTRR